MIFTDFGGLVNTRNRVTTNSRTTIASVAENCDLSLGTIRSIRFNRGTALKDICVHKGELGKFVKLYNNVIMSEDSVPLPYYTFFIENKEGKNYVYYGRKCGETLSDINLEEERIVRINSSKSDFTVPTEGRFVGVFQYKHTIPINFQTLDGYKYLDNLIDYSLGYTNEWKLTSHPVSFIRQIEPFRGTHRILEMLKGGYLSMVLSGTYSFADFIDLSLRRVHPSNQEIFLILVATERDYTNSVIECRIVSTSMAYDFSPPNVANLHYYLNTRGRNEKQIIRWDKPEYIKQDILEYAFNDNRRSLFFTEVPLKESQILVYRVFFEKSTNVQGKTYTTEKGKKVVVDVDKFGILGGFKRLKKFKFLYDADVYTFKLVGIGGVYSNDNNYPPSYEDLTHQNYEGIDSFVPKAVTPTLKKLAGVSKDGYLAVAEVTDHTLKTKDKEYILPDILDFNWAGLLPTIIHSIEKTDWSSQFESLMKLTEAKDPLIQTGNMHNIMTYSSVLDSEHIAKLDADGKDPNDTFTGRVELEDISFYFVKYDPKYGISGYLPKSSGVNGKYRLVAGHTYTLFITGDKELYYNIYVGTKHTGSIRFHTRIKGQSYFRIYIPKHWSKQGKEDKNYDEELKKEHNILNNTGEILDAKKYYGLGFKFEWRFHTFHRNRVFVAEQQKVYISEYGQYGNFNESNVLRFTSLITGLVPSDAGLFIATVNSIYLFSGWTEQDARLNEISTLGHNSEAKPVYSAGVLYTLNENNNVVITQQRNSTILPLPYTVTDTVIKMSVYDKIISLYTQKGIYVYDSKANYRCVFITYSALFNLGSNSKELKDLKEKIVSSDLYDHTVINFMTEDKKVYAVQNFLYKENGEETELAYEYPFRYVSKVIDAGSTTVLKRNNKAFITYRGEIQFKIGKSFVNLKSTEVDTQFLHFTLEERDKHNLEFEISGKGEVYSIEFNPTYREIERASS